MIEVNGKQFERRAWTGGDTPPKRYDDPDYRALRKLFFRELLAICGPLDLWKCAGTEALERAGIFWNQASLDAWRTLESGR